METDFSKEVNLALKQFVGGAVTIHEADSSEPSVHGEITEISFDCKTGKILVRYTFVYPILIDNFLVQQVFRAKAETINADRGLLEQIRAGRVDRLFCNSEAMGYLFYSFFSRKNTQSMLIELADSPSECDN